MMDMIGVIPLPAANSMMGLLLDVGIKRPVGGATSTISPTFRVSLSKFDARPSITRFTVIFSCELSFGLLDNE